MSNLPDYIGTNNTTNFRTVYKKYCIRTSKHNEKFHGKNGPIIEQTGNP